ncbi:hypothetical protein [Nocardia amamiensis]|uniref:hypothetical protein n=1 Tax=Nocardia amamiensis TaxID=404578 RepID=UPI00082DC106|nr:hypothetical protein [Nocardia amamiensis]
MSRPGSLCVALECAEGVADRIESQVRTRGEVETYGMLHLQAGLVAAILGRDPNPHLDEAAEQIDRLDTTASGTSLLCNPSFHPANVTLWRMAAAMELRDPDRVIALAPTVDPMTIGEDGRRAQYFVEVGRAYALRRDYRSSLNALLRAEHTAPQHIRTMNVVRELVGHMMRTAC